MKTYNIPIIEDSAEALEVPTNLLSGTFGEIEALSFNGNKQSTS
jgi:dTDP-4-amino-4,6-dideoxygalactose transaminase